MSAACQRQAFIEFRIDSDGRSNFREASAGDKREICTYVIADYGDFPAVHARSGFEPIERRVQILREFARVHPPIGRWLDRQTVLHTALSMAPQVDSHNSPAAFQKLF